MREVPATRHRVLAIYPFCRGIAFAAIEMPLTWLDSGTKRVSRMEGDKVWNVVENLVKKHQIDVLAVEREAVSTRSNDSLRCTANLVLSARRAGTRVALVSDREVRETLGRAPAAPRYVINALLAEAFPQLRSQEPARRRVWDPESDRAKIFRAVGIAVGALGELASDR